MSPSLPLLACLLAWAPLALADPMPAPTPAPAPATVPFTGRVLQKGERTPIAGVNVLLDDGSLSALTDASGRFAFDAVPVGKHAVHLRGATIAPADTDETFALNKRLEVTYYAIVRARYTSTVRGARLVKETVEQTLDLDEIKHIPGTQGDVLKAVQNLPGIARAPFGLGQLIVWGSAPQDTRVYVDGVYIPTLYHFGGLRSTVNSEVVQSLSFTPGGYGVDYGRGVGGVVEIESRRPRGDGYHGFVQLDTIDGSFNVEGPITKNLSFGLSARRSWIDLFLPLFTPNNLQLSPKYWDYQGRLHYKASPRDDLDLFLFGSDDQISVLTKNPDPSLSAQFDSHTYFHRVLARWIHRFTDGTQLTVTPSIGYDVPFQAAIQIGNRSFSVDAEALEYNLRAVARIPFSVEGAPPYRMDVGIDFEGVRWDLASTAPVTGMPRESDAPPSSAATGVTSAASIVYYTQVAPFVSWVLSFWDKRLTLTPALRAETYAFTGAQGTPEAFSHAYFTPEPRLAARLQVHKMVALKASIGLYHEAPDPSALLPGFGDTSLHPESSAQYVAGIEVRPTSTLSIEAEGFYKSIDGVVVRGEHPGDPLLTNQGIGRVYGGELLVRQELWKNFFGWVSYTISRSERKDHPDEDWHLFTFDQTHILTIIASYKLPRGYQVGLRFRYVTGNPATPVLVSDGGGGGYLDVNGGGYLPIYGKLNSIRLDAFNQLDIRFDKTWTFNRWKLSLYLDVQNVYDAKNPEGYQYNFNRTLKQPVAGLPIFPALGIRGDF